MPLSRAYPDLRASDAERERVAVFLRDQAAVGRLDHEELEERVAAAYRAVTVGDLERLIADLPRARPPAQRRRRHRPSRALVPVGFAALLAIAAPTALFIVLAVVAALGVAAVALVFALGVALGPFILVALLIVALTRRRRPPRRRMQWDPRYF